MAYNSQPCNEFQMWVDQNNETEGINGNGETARYVPDSSLRTYWQDDKIDEVLRSGNRDITVLKKEVIRRFIRIFSILVYISNDNASRIHYIEKFVNKDIDDFVLPFNVKPEAFPTSPEGQQTANLFLEHQFLFCPVSFAPNIMYMKKFPVETILPLKFDKELSRAADGVVLQRFSVQTSSGLSVRDDKIVMKTFPESELNYTFRNEVHTYQVIENHKQVEKASEHFLEYYGSFVQNNRGFIVLEYANEGSMLEFFKRGRLPLEELELKQLWQNFANLFVGLEMLHRLDERNVDSLRGIHQDLKPGNVFVFRDGKGNSYTYRFKIGDFGLSSVELLKAKDRERLGPDNQSTKMYAAPELVTYQDELAHLDKGATSAVDIWSLGCVLSELLVWSVCGQRGLDEFLDMRKQATCLLPQRHDGQGYGGSFHDGMNRLPAVEEMLIERLRGRVRRNEDLSLEIARFVLKEMLLPRAKDRLQAGQLHFRFLDHVLDPNSMLSPRLEISSDILTDRGYGTPSPSPRESRGMPFQGWSHARELGSKRWTDGAFPGEDRPQLNAASPVPARRQSTRWRDSSEYEDLFPGREGHPLQTPPREATNRLYIAAAADTSPTETQPLYCNSPDRLDNTLLQNPEGHAAASHRGSGVQRALAPIVPKHSLLDQDEPGHPRPHSQSSPQPLSPPVMQSNAVHHPHRERSKHTRDSSHISTVSIARGQKTNPTITEYDDSYAASTESRPASNSANEQEAGGRKHQVNGRLSKSAASNGLKSEHSSHPGPSGQPVITIRQVNERIKQSGQKSRKDSSALFPELKRELSDLKGRDQIFIIDDSKSMKTHHWQSVSDTFDALFFLVVDVDPNGVDFYLTSRPDDSHNHFWGNNESKLGKDLWAARNQDSDDVCDMEKSLSIIFKKVKEKLSRKWPFSTRPISIYIFTDAIWEGSNVIKCGVEKPIESLIAEMKRQGRERMHVSISFVRFGKDKVGRERLRWLDSELGREQNFDIVDHLSWRSDVRQMLVGSKSTTKDHLNDQDSSEDDAQSSVDGRGGPSKWKDSEVNTKT